MENEATSGPGPAIEDLPSPKSKTKHTEEDGKDSWENKIELSAVGCDIDGVVLKEPLFPFKQKWDGDAVERRKANKNRAPGKSRPSLERRGKDSTVQSAPAHLTDQNAANSVAATASANSTYDEICLSSTVADRMQQIASIGMKCKEHRNWCEIRLLRGVHVAEAEEEAEESEEIGSFHTADDEVHSNDSDSGSDEAKSGKIDEMARMARISKTLATWCKIM
jgi:hypothetical protein